MSVPAVAKINIRIGLAVSGFSLRIASIRESSREGGYDIAADNAKLHTRAIIYIRARNRHSVGGAPRVHLISFKNVTFEWGETRATRSFTQLPCRARPIASVMLAAGNDKKKKKMSLRHLFLYSMSCRRIKRGVT